MIKTYIKLILRQNICINLTSIISFLLFFLIMACGANSKNHMNKYFKEINKNDNYCCKNIQKNTHNTGDYDSSVH